MSVYVGGEGVTSTLARSQVVKSLEVYGQEFE